MDQKTYCMRLANDQVWHLAAAEGAEPCVNKLAGIMRLQPCNLGDYPKLILVRRELGKEANESPICCLGRNFLKDLPQDGWWDRSLDYPKFLYHGDTLGKLSVHFWFHNDVPDIICDIRSEVEPSQAGFPVMFLSLYPICRGVQQLGGLPLHSALIERNGIGVLLVGEGGSGKSTCCRRIPLPWRALCDDETLVIRNAEKQYIAHPFPTWSDYIHRRSSRTWDVQQHVPLAAIFSLNQSETDSVTPLGQAAAAMLINRATRQVYARSYPSLYMSLDDEEQKELKLEWINNACELVSAIPAFTLNVSFTGRFWENIYEALEESIGAHVLEANHSVA